MLVHLFELRDSMEICLCDSRFFQYIIYRSPKAKLLKVSFTQPSAKLEQTQLSFFGEPPNNDKIQPACMM